MKKLKRKSENTSRQMKIKTQLSKIYGILGTSLVVQWLRLRLLGFPGGAVVENLPANSGDMGSIPGLGRSHMPRSN